MFPDSLTDFSYFADFYKSLRELAQLALPESWRFAEPKYPTNNKETPILERYLRSVYRHHAQRCNSTLDMSEKQHYIFNYGTIACFNTGLLSAHFEDIFALFEKSSRSKRRFDWTFRGFHPKSSNSLRSISQLPDRPVYYGPAEMFRPEWEIRINFPHILTDEANRERLPAEIRDSSNLPLLLHAAVLYGQALARIDATNVVPQVYNDRIQYLLPICLTDLRYCDLAMTLTACEGFYVASTCLSLEMAYHNARLFSKPSASWLEGLVDQDAIIPFDYEAIYGMKMA